MAAHKHRWRSAIGPVVALALTLTACNSDEEQPPDDAGTTQEETPTREETPEDASGGAATEDEDPPPADAGESTETAVTTHALGEPSGPRMFHENSFGDAWDFDVTVERVEGGSWDDLAGTDLVAEDHPGFDPLYVQLSLTNESGPYEGPDPTGSLLVQADDGGPFEPENALSAVGLPDWCASPGADRVISIDAGETQTMCQVVLVGHGVSLTSVDWRHRLGAERWLTQS
ncbi:hypothetical protein [Streptomyces sp. NPDC127098]|uniref:hypothetical protein n=1 Tax=Streptomyces sp. NPDC127098 TaxID=3347137 RepID=UPI00364D6584